MANQNLERKEINDLTFFKPQFRKNWVISGVDICRYLGYKNPYQQSKKIYNKYKEYFSESSYVLELPRPTKAAKGGIQSRYALYDKNLQEIRCYTRPGCWFFVAQCKIPIALKIVEKLFKSYDDLLKILEAKNTLEWKEAREQGKIGRRQMTDAVQQFINYAKDKGSEHADNYYILFTKSIYSACFSLKGKVPKNFRDNLTPYELAVLNLLEISTDQELYDLMEKNISYKDIFKEVKEVLTKKAMALVKT